MPCFRIAKTKQKYSWADCEYILAWTDQISVNWFISQNVSLKDVHV